MIGVFSLVFDPGGIQMNLFGKRALTLIALLILTAASLIAAPDSKNDQSGVNADISKKFTRNS